MAEPPVAPMVSAEGAAEQVRSTLAARQDLSEAAVSSDAAAEVESASSSTAADAAVDAEEAVAEVDSRGLPDAAETAAAADASAPTAPKAMQIFDLQSDAGDTPPAKSSSAEGVSSTPACTSAPISTGDWYSLDEEQANEALQQRSQEEPSEENPQLDAAAMNKSKNWASKLSKKAGKWGGAAKTAFLAEAKLVAADAKDLALGVREGAQITIQDTKSLSKQIHRDAKSLATAAGGWRGLWRGGKKDQESTASTEEAEGIPSGSSSGATATESTGSGAQAPDPAADVALPVAPDEPSEPSTGAAVEPDGVDSSPTAGPATLQAIRQSWAATAEVSRTMWKDIKEANLEAMQDLKSGVQELAQGVQNLRRSSGAGLEDGTAAAAAAAAASGAVVATEPSSEDSEAGPQETDQAVASSTEALDTLQDGESGDLPNHEETDAARGLFDPRTPAEKAFDEKAAQVAQRVEEVWSVTAAASTKLWRKTEQGIKKGFAAVPEISRGAGTPGSGPAGTAFFTPASRAEVAEAEPRHFDTYRVLPSVRANYVELAAADLSALPGDPSLSGDLQASQNANKAARAAARRARKLGGKIAKRSREVSSGLLKQAQVLGQNVQAGAAEAAAAARSAVAATAPSASDTSLNNTGDEACEDDIFEIGSEDEDLFSDSDSDGAEAPEGNAEDEEEEIFTAADSAVAPTAPVAVAPTAPVAVAPTAPVAVAASAPVAVVPNTGSSAKSGQEDALVDLLFDASDMQPASTTAPDSAASVTSAVASPAAKVQSSVDLLGDHSVTAAAPVAPAAPAPAAPAPAAPAATRASVAPPEPPDAQSEDPFADLLAETSAPPAPSTTALPPPKPASAAPGQLPAAAPSLAGSAPATAAGTSSQLATGAKLDFLAAAEKELEDLFGDDD